MWCVSLTRFDDVAGNIKFWYPDTLKAAGFQTDIAVANTPDTTPPTTAFDAAVTYAGPATIHLTATDNTGVAHVGLVLAHPQPQGLGMDSQITGDRGDGTLRLPGDPDASLSKLGRV